MGSKGQIQINSFEELVQFIEENELTIEQKRSLVNNALKIYYDGSFSNEILIPRIKKYWAKYGHIKERPLFLDDGTREERDARIKELQEKAKQ